jgi:2-aminoadipate transaminase
LDLSTFNLDSSSDTPIYKQLAEFVRGMIDRGIMCGGERLPATRELAGQLGLNRTTVSAAYSLLEEAGLIEGQVGRGSFVAKSMTARRVFPARDWDSILPPVEAVFKGPVQHVEISFASSRPADDQFPLAEFRKVTRQVIDGPDAADILQLGSAYGYAPLRRYLMEQTTGCGMARAGDDLMITNGCQQALDLIARVFAAAGVVVLEDPVYHGVVRVFSRMGAEVVTVPVGEAGLDPNALEQIFERTRPKLLVVTPSFQNPTGASLSLEGRRRVVAVTQRFGCVVVENGIYSELRYAGSPLPTLKELDETGNTILLGSYSKVGFPGLRVGWVIGPRPVITRLADAKEVSDLHSDHLSQAVLLKFAESGELKRHLERTREAGAERLSAVLRACAQYLPLDARYTKPQGGMSLWIELPAPLTADTLLNRVQERGVNFVPGRHFSTRNIHARNLRISFGALSPEQITRGIKILGDTAKEELAAALPIDDFEPAAALV